MGQESDNRRGGAINHVILKIQYISRIEGRLATVRMGLHGGEL